MDRCGQQLVRPSYTPERQSCKSMRQPTVQRMRTKRLNFHHQLQTVYNRTPRRDVILVMGDFNAKIDNNNAVMQTVLPKAEQHE